ncbi:hypothetical protein RD729_002043 [Enterococcus faecium]|nr:MULTISPECIES: hypothetical protein [Enterococcus]EKZ0498951.1 hypothetical protein [Enterococcus faecium]KAB1934682.1 hypothetical protein F8181_12360 [Enterococcus faecium]KAB7520312.1 hypothetical protein F8A91_13435 [Enterococcus faecium]MBY3652908.1 hypothetical protein [Enterococcus faecium]MCH3577937.1 hypothetical protein [Enterococcus faecium]
MIEKRLIYQIYCLDHNADTLELIESICSNTIVLDLRAVNDDYVTHIIVNKKMAQKLSESLKKWAEGGNNENN